MPTRFRQGGPSRSVAITRYSCPIHSELGHIYRGHTHRQSIPSKCWVQLVAHIDGAVCVSVLVLDPTLWWLPGGDRIPLKPKRHSLVFLVLDSLGSFSHRNHKLGDVRCLDRATIRVTLRTELLRRRTPQPIIFYQRESLAKVRRWIRCADRRRYPDVGPRTVGCVDEIISSSIKQNGS